MRTRMWRVTRGWSIVFAVVVAGCAPAAPAYAPPTVPLESRDLTQADIERLVEELSNWGTLGNR